MYLHLIIYKLQSMHLNPGLIPNMALCSVVNGTNVYWEASSGHTPDCWETLLNRQEHQASWNLYSTRGNRVCKLNSREYQT